MGLSSPLDMVCVCGSVRAGSLNKALSRRAGADEITNQDVAVEYADALAISSDATQTAIAELLHKLEKTLRDPRALGSA
jgi:hypothetical protein